MDLESPTVYRERARRVALQPVETNLTLLDHYDRLLTDLALPLTRTAKVHDVNAFYRLRSVPGIGKILALVLLYEIHDIRRFPSVQDFVSYCRLVKCGKESDGKHYGYSGAKIGNAHLKWAFSEAAVLCLHGNPGAQRYVSRLATKHGKGKALTILAHQLARAVYYMLPAGTPLTRTGFSTTPAPGKHRGAPRSTSRRRRRPRPARPRSRARPSDGRLTSLLLLPPRSRWPRPSPTDSAREARMSLAPNWTPDGTEPDPMHHTPVRPRPRACISACDGPAVPCVDWTPGLLDYHARRSPRELWAAPRPSRALTGTGPGPEPARIESAGRRARMSF